MAVSLPSVPGFEFRELMLLCYEAEKVGASKVVTAALLAFHSARAEQPGAYDAGQPAILFTRLVKAAKGGEGNGAVTAEVSWA